MQKMWPLESIDELEEEVGKVEHTCGTLCCPAKLADEESNHGLNLLLSRHSRRRRRSRPVIDECSFDGELYWQAKSPDHIESLDPESQEEPFAWLDQLDSIECKAREMNREHNTSEDEQQQQKQLPHHKAPLSPGQQTLLKRRKRRQSAPTVATTLIKTPATDNGITCSEKNINKVNTNPPLLESSDSNRATELHKTDGLLPDELARLEPVKLMDQQQEQLEQYYSRIRAIDLPTYGSITSGASRDKNSSTSPLVRPVGGRQQLASCHRSPSDCCARSSCYCRQKPASNSELEGSGKKLENQQELSLSKKNCVNWGDISRRYGKHMASRHNPTRGRGGGRANSWRHSCLCNLILSSIQFLFPFLTSFKDYNLPNDLVSDLVAGFTIAVLHIPQGMAYGLLAGVEPINGLYVSFVPVLVMVFMSRSRHVSYGTFAVVSMMLASATDNVKQAIQRQLIHPSTLAPSISTRNASFDGLVLVNNHRAVPTETGSTAQQLLRDLLVASQAATGGNLNTGEQQQQQQQVSSSLMDSMVTDFVMPSNIEILTCICLVVGLIQAFMAFIRLGALSLMFSDQLISSFTCASAIHVLSSQLAGLFDLQLETIPDGTFKVCRIWWAFLGRMLEGTFNMYTAALSLTSILFLITVKEFIEPKIRRRLGGPSCLPSELVLMGFVIFCSWYWRFNEVYDINTIGHIPSSLPTPQMPRLDLAPLVMQDALTVALVSFAMNLSLAQMYAKRFRYKMSPNQELFALGTSNVVGSFFSCFPCASSLSRSAVQSNLNVRSPICPLFSCAVVVSIICYFAHILYDLPRSTLSCIIVVALKGILIQCKDLKENWLLSKLDALVWVTTFVSVIAFGVTYGLILGIIASLVIVFFRLFTPNYSILGQVPGTEIYVDVNCFIDCTEIEQVRIFRFNSALCYLNRTMFKSSIEESVPCLSRKTTLNIFRKLLWPKKEEHFEDDNRIRFLIIDCSALAYCDYSGASTLIEIIEEFGERKVSVYLAACPLALVNMIEKMGNTQILEQQMFPTITDAVRQAKFLMRNNQSGDEQSYQKGACLQSILSCQPKE